MGIDREHGVSYAALGTAPAASFAFPGSPKGLSYPCLAIHDVHHGSAANCKCWASRLPLLQFQMGIADPRPRPTCGAI